MFKNCTVDYKIIHTLFLYKWNRLLTIFGNTLIKIYGSREVILLCDNNNKVGAHKLFLALCSSLFR